MELCKQTGVNGLFQLGGYPETVQFLRLLSNGGHYSKDEMRVTLLNTVGCFFPALEHDINSRGRGKKASRGMQLLLKHIILAKSVDLFEKKKPHNYELWGTPRARRTDQFPCWKPIRNRPVYQQDLANVDTIGHHTAKRFAEQLKSTYVEPQQYQWVIELEKAELMHDDGWCKNEHPPCKAISPGVFIVTCGHSIFRG